MPGGQPTKYDPKFCKEVIELGAKGKSITQIAFALKIAKKTIYNWADAHEEFLHSIEEARDLAQGWWEDQGHENLHNKNFQARLWEKNMQARFRNDWLVRTETVAKIDLTGSLKELKEVEAEYKEKNKREY